MKMTKSDIKALMREHYILERELIDIIRIVHDLLIQKMEILKQTEPYSRVSICALYNAAREVDYLESDIEEIMEGDKNENED